MNDNDKFTKYKGEVHDGTEFTAPYPVSRLAPQIKLLDLAREIESADKVINVRVSAKLQVIVDQIKALQEEAQIILATATMDQELHKVQCNFRKVPGSLYHLYQRKDGGRYFSMLTPADWADKPPHDFIDSYYLNNDMSWTAASAKTQGEDTRELVRRLLTLSLTDDH